MTNGLIEVEANYVAPMQLNKLNLQQLEMLQIPLLPQPATIPIPIRLLST